MRFLRELFVTSKAYRFTMLIMFVGYFLITWMFMNSLYDSSSNITSHLIARALLEALLLVAICHFLVRPYLRRYMLAMSLTAETISKALIYLVFASVVYFAISYMVGKIDFLSAIDISSVYVQTQDGLVASDINLWLIALLGTGQSFVILTTWSVLYLIFKYQKNKREFEKEMVSIQIQQLTTQLSPHFLFNTLNSIRALIFVDQERASEAITLLSDLLRSQTKTQLQSQSTFKEDWMTTRNYLNIELIRFEDRMSIKTNFDQEIMHQLLPTLTLLTLTENAVKHGISPSGKAGFIHITARKLSAKRWQLMIVNSVYNDVKNHGTQIGLRNIRKRLNLFYGENFAFITKLENNAYTVKMELPYVENIIS
ncbi:histidine kinase [Pseudidiomarina sp. 1APP75-27a]|uniref:sensor histidine kinase n=1 Tax=Pseudidiomarina terrestris TaxID=2820060 RepID=UPI002B059633|nr:histidine kinase [Pseudidiomarina sp. 1APP75-27a]MEA3588430.1 histidine kinase [Pseudidiomarina sp. 1APP75-27a]